MSGPLRSSATEKWGARSANWRRRKAGKSRRWSERERAPADAGLPEAQWRNQASYILFAVGSFAPELHSLAADPQERLSLVSGADLLAEQTASAVVVSEDLIKGEDENV